MKRRSLRAHGRARHGALGVAAAVVLVAGGLRAVRPSQVVSSIPVVEVRRTEFLDVLPLRGDITPIKSIVLAAPSEGEGDLRILRVARAGSRVRKGDIVIQIDPTSVQRMVEEKRSEMKRAEAEIEKTRAQAKIQAELDLTAVEKSRYDLQRARLDVGRDDLMSRVDAEEKKLGVDDAQNKVREAEAKLSADRVGADADVERGKQKRDKAELELRHAEAALASMALKAPADGMVTLLPNWRAGGFAGSAPEFREGDRPWPGAALAELPDLSAALVSARVDESDRSRIRTGQHATVKVDALPGVELSGEVVDISPLARPDFSSWPPIRNFDVSVRLARTDERLRPRMSAMLRIVVERVAGALVIPPDAAFTRGAYTVAYVVDGSRFVERRIEVTRRSADALLVSSGLNAGEKVATRNPNQDGSEVGPR